MKNYNEISAQQSDISRIVDLVYAKGYNKAYNDRKIEEEFDEDRAKAIKEAYQKGLDDAWECAKKLLLPYGDGGYTHKEFRDIFTESSLENIMTHHSASEVIAKIKEYEEKKKVDDEIKVGDEVMVDKRCMIVLGIDSGKWKHLWCPSNGFTYNNILTSEMTKTGRHFDIQNMLKQIKSSEDKKA